MKGKLLILVLVGLSLSSCAQGGFSPGPKGPIGPQGDLGPQGPIGPSSDDISSSGDAIVIEDTGELVQSEYSLRGFSVVEVGGFFTAEIHQGESYRVVVEAEEALMPYLDVVVRGETLHVGLKSGYIFNIENASQRIEVTLPALSRVSISNHSMLILEDFETEETLRVRVADFGELQGTITAGGVEIEVTNHSELTLSGSASQMTGEVTEFSEADLTGLRAEELDIDTDTHSSLTQ
jgi:hypothetical protein